VHTVQSGELDLATPDGRMKARILGSVASRESEHRSERVKRKMKETISNGTYLGGPRPFGFKANGMELEPAEAAMVRKGTEAILGGASLRNVTGMFDDSGVKRVRSPQSQWATNVVKIILMRARNAALVECGGKVVGPASWPAIVSEDEWRAVCSILGNPARNTTKGSQPRWLGSGLYRCGVCGGPLVVGTSGRKVNPSYCCRTNKQRGGSRHVLVERMSRDDAAPLFAPPTLPKAQLDALRAELARVHQDRLDLAEELGRGEIPVDIWRTADKGLALREKELEARLAAAIPRNPVRAWVTAEDVAAHWDSRTLEQRRELMRLVGIQVTVHHAPRGRRPVGSLYPYFDETSVEIEWLAV
jgi:hypothetical protein